MQNCYSLLVPEILIPNGSDLNDYTTPGHYYTPNAAASQTIQNTPYTGSGFKLIVEKLSSNSHVLQTLKGVNSKFVYYRAASDSDFRDWLTPVTNADLDNPFFLKIGSDSNKWGGLDVKISDSEYLRFQVNSNGRVELARYTNNSLNGVKVITESGWS